MWRLRLGDLLGKCSIQCKAVIGTVHERQPSVVILKVGCTSWYLRECGKIQGPSPLLFWELEPLFSLVGSRHIRLHLFPQSHPACSSSELCTFFFPLLECLSTFLTSRIWLSLPVICPWVSVLAFHNPCYLHNCLCGVCILPCEAWTPMLGMCPTCC